MIWLYLILNTSLAFTAPTSFVDKADSTPNICQSCFPTMVKWGGKPHCAPAAVSNSLSWLADNGFPSLQPFHSDTKDKDQARLVDKLGETMGTTENAGTTPSMVMTGLKNYLDENKVKYKRLSAVGWRTVPEFVPVDSPKVSLSWIQEGILGKNSTWLLIGWCKFEHEKSNCKIYDGHWMTVVGYGKDRAGKLDPDILIIHDPAERAERKNYYPRIVRLKQGTINSNIRAEDVLSIEGDIVLKPGADHGVIQGAYRLEI